MGNKHLLGASLASMLVGCMVGTGDVDVEGEAPPGESAAELKRNALSEPEQKVALKLIDDICGDTWCSGDYDFGFRRISCQTVNNAQSGTCTLTLQIFPREGVPSARRMYWRSCKTGGFSGFDSLVRTTNGYQSLQEDYYSALTDCIQALESRLPDGVIKAPQAPAPSQRGQ